MRLPKLMLVVAVVSLVAGLTATHVYASGSTIELETAVETAPQKRMWTLGLGAAAVPDYEGSEDYKAAPLPLIKVVDPSGWYVELIGNTLRANVLPNPTWSLGPMARYRAERDDVDNDKVDDMEEVDAAVEVGGFLGFQHGGWLLRVEAVTDVADGHEGSLVGLTGGYTWKPAPWRLTLSAFSTYASEDYMSAYFGVDSRDASRSGLKRYNADAGIKDVGATFVAGYRLTDHWGVTGAARYTLLVGDAADSPLVEDEGDENQFLVGALVTYTF